MTRAYRRIGRLVRLCDECGVALTRAPARPLALRLGHHLFALADWLVGLLPPCGAIWEMPQGSDGTVTGTAAMVGVRCLREAGHADPEHAGNSWGRTVTWTDSPAPYYGGRVE